MRRRVSALACVGMMAAGAFVATGSGAGAAPANPYHLAKPGTLTVGMDLQFKPEMYLTTSGKPAGYDVHLLKALAKAMHVKLKIDNLDFTGLIPGLQSKKFDLVSVGLTPTAIRKKAVSFSRSYVPYELVLAAAKNSTIAPTIAAWNTSGVTITALLGSTDASQVTTTFPSATLQTFPDDTTALLQMATGRADGAVVEDYILGQFNKANNNELATVALPAPLSIAYGSYAVQKGNSKFVKYLNTFICKQQRSGSMAKLYENTEGATTLPKMPAC
jgi:ABC-type amino acid transport substrate-binding protein